MQFQGPGKPQGMYFHFIPPDPAWGESEYLGLAEVLSEWWQEPGGPFAAPQSFQGRDTTLLQFVLHFIPRGTRPFLAFLVSFLVDVIGSGPEPVISPAQCPVISLRTAGPFRKGNGRLYFPGLSRSFTDGSNQAKMDGVAQENLGSTFNGLRDFLTFAYAPNPAPIWVVWNRTRQVGGREAMPTVSPVQEARILTPVMGSQRLRQEGQRIYDYAAREPG